MTYLAIALTAFIGINFGFFLYIIDLIVAFVDDKESPEYRYEYRPFFVDRERGPYWDWFDILFTGVGISILISIFWPIFVPYFLLLIARHFNRINKEKYKK